MTEYERSGQPWRDDPAATLVDELYRQISEELGTDGPAATFGHGDLHHLGHLVGGEAGVVAEDSTDVLALDSLDTEDLAAEELAMHYLDDAGGSADSADYGAYELDPDVRRGFDPDDDEIVGAS